MKTPASIRRTLAGAALLAATPWPCVAQLRVVAELQGQPAPLVAVDGTRVLVDFNGRRVPVGDDGAWRLEGDLAANTAYVRWSPNYTLRATTEAERAVYPDKVLQAEFVVRRSAARAPDLGGERGEQARGRSGGGADDAGGRGGRGGRGGGGAPTGFAAEFPEPLANPGAIIAFWLLDGKPTDLAVAPIPAQVEFGWRFTFPLTAAAAAGQPAYLVWSDDHFLTPTPLFVDPPTQDAMVAILRGDASALQRAIADKAKLTLNSRAGLMPGHYAAEAGSIAAIDVMLEERSKFAAEAGVRGHTPLEVAAGFGRTAALAHLLEASPRGAFNRELLSSAVVAAAPRGHAEAVRLLIQAGALERPTARDSDTLEAAIQAGFSDIAEMLVARGVALKSADSDHQNALFSHALQGNEAMVRWLMAHGVSPDFDLEGKIPLIAAARLGSAAFADALIAGGAKPNHAAANGYTALMAAAAAGNTAYARALLQHDADVHAATDSAHTALHHAAQSGDAELVQLLLERGAEVNPVTAQGDSPLVVALIAGTREAAAVLARAGAKVDLRSPHAAAALESAVRNDLGAVVAAALADGWDASSKFADAWPALRLAQVFDAKSCVEVLTRAGATADENTPVPLAKPNELDAALRLTRAVVPDDPRASWEVFLPATVQVDFLVDASGRPTFPHVAAAPDPRLIPAVLGVLPSWRFNEPKKGGQPAAVRVALPFQFKGSKPTVAKLEPPAPEAAPPQDQ